MTPKVVGLFVSSTARGVMVPQSLTQAIKGKGLKGDRYLRGGGSYNKGRQGHRQVTLIDAAAFVESGFKFCESRRNIVVEGFSLNEMIDKEFYVGAVRMRGLQLCEPCTVPTKLYNKEALFSEVFAGRGGLVAEVLTTEFIRVGNPVFAR